MSASEIVTFQKTSVILTSYKPVSVAEAIQHQQRERTVPLVELGDPLVDPVEPRITAGRLDEQPRGVLDVQPALVVPAFLAAPGKRRVQRHPVNPGGGLAIAAPSLDAVPELQRDFLEEILAIGMRGTIDSRHLEQDGLVRVNPALAYAVPFSVYHRLRPLPC